MTYRQPHPYESIGDFVPGTVVRSDTYLRGLGYLPGRTANRPVAIPQLATGPRPSVFSRQPFARPVAIPQLAPRVNIRGVGGNVVDCTCSQNTLVRHAAEHAAMRQAGAMGLGVIPVWSRATVIPTWSPSSVIPTWQPRSSYTLRGLGACEPELEADMQTNWNPGVRFGTVGAGTGTGSPDALFRAMFSRRQFPTGTPNLHMQSPMSAIVMRGPNDDAVTSFFMQPDVKPWLYVGGTVGVLAIVGLIYWAGTRRKRRR